MVSATAARAMTAPAGDHPAPIRDEANVPDVPKVIADSRPSASPAPRRRPAAAAPATSPGRTAAGSWPAPVPRAVLPSCVRTVLIVRSSATGEAVSGKSVLYL